MKHSGKPRFVVYQPNKKEFHICLEAGGKYLVWCSYYPPTLDARFPREVTRIADIPVKAIPPKQVFDQGTYGITKSKPADKESIEAQTIEGITQKSFSFVLNGKILKGRFAFKRTGNSTVIQKFKDKYAREEDVLSDDLVRTIHTMVPDYDASKVKLRHHKTAKPDVPEAEPEEQPAQDITQDKKIGNKQYRFTFYSSTGGEELCLARSEEGTTVVLEKQGNEWVVLQPVSTRELKPKDEFSDHAKALEELRQ